MEFAWVEDPNDYDMEQILSRVWEEASRSLFRSRADRWSMARQAAEVAAELPQDYRPDANPDACRPKPAPGASRFRCGIFIGRP